jgi:uncharacterized phage protein gp47/JayE
VIGLLLGILAERLHEIWLGERDLYSARVAGSASDQALTDLSLETGTRRALPTFSKVTASVTLNAGITLPAGSEARVPGASVEFATDVSVTNGGGSPAVLPVAMTATGTGPTVANAASLTEIVTPVSGWTAVTNATDAVLGQDDESDTALRLRREAELRVQGGAAIDAIVADVRRVAGAIDATGTDFPGTSTYQITLWDGVSPAASNDAVAQAIWNSRSLGSLSLGAASGTAFDADGNPHTIGFARATGVPIYITVDISIDSLRYPSDGAAQIKAALMAYALAHWTVGADVIVSALYAPIFSISGVTRIDSLKVGLAPSPTLSADLVIAADAIALADTGRTTVIV